MADVFDMKPFGGPELQRMFNQLPELVQKRILPSAIRASAHRVKAQVGLAWSGAIVQEWTGRAADAFADVKIRKQKTPDDTTIVFGTKLPERDKLGISPEDDWYYPAIVEYGAPHFAAKAPIRKTVDRIADSEFAAIGRDIGKRIERRAKRLAKARGIS